MTTLLSRLKGSNAPNSPTAGATPTKKGSDTSAALTPLEELLAGAGSLRGDGSDKFFGMHNPSNTCYCNSVVQCLYRSEAFREQVVNYPRRSPPGAILRLNTSGLPMNNEPIVPISPGPTAKPGGFFNMGANKTTTQPSPTASANKPEENKDSFDYQKKQAYACGPHIRMEGTNYELYGMPESLFTGLKDLFEAMIGHQSRIGVVSPSRFLEVLKRDNETFRTPMHQDAHEFLNLLLNEVVDQVENYSKKTAQVSNGSRQKPQAQRVASEGAPPAVNSSWVHELFEGTLTSETRCLTCENVSQRDEVFLDLSVDLEEHSSVTSCLRKFSAKEMLCERNKFHCDPCGGLQEAEKRMKIKRLPRILALHLKRFKYIEELGRLQKLFHRVVYPFHLRLFNTTDDAENPDRLYELYAVIVHLGTTPFHGHYVSIVKTKDRGWLLFDDELVLPVEKNYVRNFFGGGISPACAYVLFYQETTVEAMEREQEAEGFVADAIVSMNAASLTLDTNQPMSPLDASPGVLLKTPTSEEPEVYQRLQHAATTPTWSPPKCTTRQADDYMASSNEPLLPNGATARTYEEPKLNGEDAEHSAARANENGRPGLTQKASSFSRFRPASMSLRQKTPKFWSAKEKEGMKEEASDTSSPITARNSMAERPEEAAVGGADKDKEEPEKKKRFGMGRKRMSMMG